MLNRTECIAREPSETLFRSTKTAENQEIYQQSLHLDSFYATPPHKKEHYTLQKKRQLKVTSSFVGVDGFEPPTLCL